MKEKNLFFKKTTTAIILAGILLMPISGLAQNTSYTGGSSGGNINGYIKGLLPTIAKLPECQKAIGDGIKGLFKKTKEIGPRLENGSFYGEEATEEATSASTSVSTYDQNANRKLNSLLKSTGTIENDTASLKRKATCTEAIGRMVVKLLLQKMTLATVEWIKNGNNGEPFFVQGKKYFENIAKEEILGFGLEINDPNKFPFGKAFLQSQVNAFNNHFQQNAEYSLDKLIQDTTPQYSALTFSANFEDGGWGAWNSMTQIPANNPLGFQLLASAELNARLAGTDMSNAQWIDKGLQSAGGWLPDSRCADPIGVTKEEHEAALAGSSNMYPAGAPRLCKRWESVTPGSIVASLAQSAVNYPKDALLDAEDLNDAIAAVLDALLAKWTAKITDKGLAELSNDDNDISMNSFYSGGDSSSQTEKDIPDSYLTASSWLKDNPDFNIRTDLSQAVIDEQRTYIEKLEQQNKILPELLKTVYQLDYCIPGPHPEWEDEARTNLDKAESTILDADLMDEDTFKKVAETLGGHIYQLGQALNIGTGKNKKKELYSGYFEAFTGLVINTDQDDLPIEPHDALIDVMDIMFDRYAEAIDKVFIPEIMPGVTTEARQEFLKTPGYKKIIEGNKKTIAEKKSIISRLSNIKTKIDSLNSQLASGALNSTSYEENLKPWITSFARISIDMVSGNDIAVADTMWKQLIDKKDYIYKDLLIGPAGCENDTSLLPWQILDNRRSYPFTILYDYASYAQGATLPSGNKNPFFKNPGPNSFLNYGMWGATMPKMQVQDVKNIQDFCKSYVQYGYTTESACNSGAPSGPNIIPFNDLVPTTYLDTNYSTQTVQTFEQTIGIY